MPTVLHSGPYRFYFWSHELNEPPHIHVDRDELFGETLIEARIARSESLDVTRMYFGSYTDW
jgi:hypothetical protein